MLINYIVIAYHKPRQLERLVRRLKSPCTIFHIHIDKSMDVEPFRNRLNNLSNVHFLEGADRKHTPWSDIGFPLAALAAFHKCIETTTDKGYCVLLSGQDYPLKGNRHIRNFFEKHYGKNFIDIKKVSIWPEWKLRLERYNFHLPAERTRHGIFPLVDRRFLSIRNFRDIAFVGWRLGVLSALKAVLAPKRRHPEGFIPMGGSAWWAFPIETVHLLVTYLKKHPEFLEYHRYTHVPDEIIFHTLLNAMFPENEIEPSLTYVNWERPDVVLPVVFRDRRDLKELLSLDASYLFARKFEVSEDFDILDYIDDYIDNTTEPSTP